MKLIRKYIQDVIKTPPLNKELSVHRKGYRLEQRKSERDQHRDTAEILDFQTHGISQVSRQKVKRLQEEKLRLNSDLLSSHSRRQSHVPRTEWRKASSGQSRSGLQTTEPRVWEPILKHTRWAVVGLGGGAWPACTFCEPWVV